MTACEQIDDQRKMTKAVLLDVLDHAVEAWIKHSVEEGLYLSPDLIKSVCVLWRACHGMELK